jgi:nucleotide-binding universal stress UspA family protein
MQQRKPPVVVGVDGSAEALTAAEFAADEARRRGLPLLVQHGFMWPSLYPPLLDPDPSDPGPRVRARELLDHTTETLRGKHPDLIIDGHLRNGPPAAMLVEASRRAALIVLGHRGSGGFAGLHVGSVAIHTAAHAHCPVAVVRGRPSSPGDPVVLGIDGSPESAVARGYAFEAARVRHAQLKVVAVWPPSARDRPAHEVLVEYLGDLPDRYPDVALLPRLVHGESPAGALITEAHDGGLIVVGSRGVGGLRGILLGSVGRALIAHAPCPVVIVRNAA